MSGPALPGARVALVGAGHWGKNLARNLYALGALAVVCDSDPAAVERVGSQYPVPGTTAYEDVLADPAVDAVAIATPAESHESMVEAALAAGKDVFVEKPLCLGVAAGERLVGQAAAGERILMVGHLLRYHPAVVKLGELVDGGALGRLQYIYSNRLNLGKIRREENILWSFAPHDISVILGLVREMPEMVDALGGHYLHARIADVTVSHLGFPSGVKAHVFVSWLHPFKEQRLVVVGDRAMAVFEDTAPRHKLLLYPHSIEWREGMPIPSGADAEVVAFPAGEPLRAECEHFLDCIATRRRPLTDGAEGVRVLRVLERCQEALDR